MKTIYKILKVLGLVLIIFCVLNVEDIKRDLVIERVKNSVVNIKIYNRTGMFLGHGSGTIISKTTIGNKYKYTIVSCEHIVVGAKYKAHFNVDALKSNMDEIKLVFVHPRADMSIFVMISDKEYDYIPVDFNHNVEYGTRILSISYPNENDRFLSEGSISTFENDGKYSMDITISSGSSGSGTVEYSIIPKLIGVNVSAQRFGVGAVIPISYSEPIYKLNYRYEGLHDYNTSIAREVYETLKYLFK